MNIAEWFKGALSCKTKEEAQEWLNREVKEHSVRHRKTEEESRRIILSDLGYVAGYYSQETADKILELFGAQHPIFGRDYFSKHNELR